MATPKRANVNFVEFDGNEGREVAVLGVAKDETKLLKFLLLLCLPWMSYILFLRSLDKNFASPSALFYY